MITENYISFETAKLLKDKGFDVDECEVHYDPEDHTQYDITQQMAMKWLREKHKITIGILFKGDRIYYEIHQNNEFVFGVDTPESYEKVCDEAIKYCLENLI